VRGKDDGVAIHFFVSCSHPAPRVVGVVTHYPLIATSCRIPRILNTRKRKSQSNLPWLKGGASPSGSGATGSRQS
jgi:hypothetical protein